MGPGFSGKIPPLFGFPRYFWDAIVALFLSGHFIFRAVHGSLYLDRSVDLFILDGPRIPIFRAVRRFLFSEPSVDPFIRSGLWFSLIRAVHGSLYLDRSVDPFYSGPSMDPYIQFSPWIPTFRSARESLFWTVHGSLYMHSGPCIPLLS